MSRKLIPCKSCGAQIAASAKTCPACGAKNKKPFFKKWWFWAIIIVVVLIVVGPPSDNNNTPDVTTPSITEPTMATQQTEADTPTTTEPPATETPSTPEESTPAETQATLIDGMRPEFKDALDSYEAFFKEYCDYITKFNANPTDLGLLADYANYVAQYADMMSKLDALDDGELNDAELKYYIDVTARITKMLADVAE